MKKSWFTGIALITVYRFVLGFAFTNFVMPVYASDAQYAKHGDMNTAKTWVGYAVVWFCLALFGTMREDAPVSRFVMFLQLLMVVVPFTVLFGAQDLPAWYMGTMVFGYASTIAAARWIPVIHFPRPSDTTRLVLACVMVAITAYVYLGLIATGGFSHMNINLDDVYEYRDIYTENMLLGFGYFVPWIAYIFNMAWLVSALRRKSIVEICIVMLLQLLIFAMTNFKSFLLVPFAVIGTVSIIRKGEFRRTLIVGTTCVLLGLCGLSAIGKSLGPALLNRMFFVPAALHGLYFDYFSNHAKSLMGGSPIGSLLGSSYSESSVYVVSQEYWGRYFSPNVGWIGDAYANFGIYGVGISAIVLGAVLRMADGFAERLEPPGAEGIMVGPTLALCSSALGTVLLTHGLAMGLIVLWIFKNAPVSRRRAQPVRA
jgi:hypothetical protein